MTPPDRIYEIVSLLCFKTSYFSGMENGSPGKQNINPLKTNGIFHNVYIVTYVHQAGPLYILMAILSRLSNNKT